jgi:DNA polymerase III delta prime subunit
MSIKIPNIINKILEREQLSNEIKNILNNFDNNHANVNYKKGIYIYGSPGCGKTEFVLQLLNEMNYDVIKYDAGDVRNKSLIENITSNNIAKCNVLQMMSGITKKIAIVMDEVDGMNNGDKGGITSLIKLIRQKKTKKQKLENKTMNPIICIGNYYIDKKIKELMKVCYTFELKTPNVLQMSKIIDEYIPKLNSSYKKKLVDYIQGDLRKLDFVIDMYSKKPDFINDDTLHDIFLTKSFNEDSKKLTQSLINVPHSIEEHNRFMNETERTIVALLWHENIIEPLNKVKKEKAFPFYIKILENICFADYTDRITFQNQIWQFNEMSSLIKTFYNNKIYHDTFPENINGFHPTEVRFTKVLTKYSTEYNNILFIFNLCQEMDMDKKDLISFFQGLRLYYGKDFFNSPDVLNNVENIFQDYNINKLDIKRMYRYLDKNVKKDSVSSEEDLLDIEEDL